MEHVILDMIDDNSWKTQDVRFYLVAFDCICSTLQDNIKDMYLSLKNDPLFPMKCWFPRLSPTEHNI